MNEVITRWITAKVTLLPREGDRPQRPPCIFTGYRNSNLRFECSGRGGYGLPLGGAILFPVGRAEMPIGETGPVHMRIYGFYEEATLHDALRVGARFLLTEGGRPVIRGTITALLPDAPDLLHSSR